MLSKFITGTICDTVFDQVKNLPTNEDGVALFKIFMSFTVIKSLQLSILYLNQIMILLLSTYNYAIPTINTKLTHLFLIACTTTRILENAGQI